MRSPARGRRSVLPPVRIGLPGHRRAVDAGAASPPATAVVVRHASTADWLSAAGLGRPAAAALGRAAAAAGLGSAAAAAGLGRTDAAGPVDARSDSSAGMAAGTGRTARSRAARRFGRCLGRGRCVAAHGRRDASTAGRRTVGLPAVLLALASRLRPVRELRFRQQLGLRRRGARAGRADPAAGGCPGPSRCGAADRRRRARLRGPKSGLRPASPSSPPSRGRPGRSAASGGKLGSGSAGRKRGRISPARTSET